MRGRTYEAGFDTITIGTAVQDIFFLFNSASNGSQIHNIHLAAAGVTTAAQIRLRLKRGLPTNTAGSGGTAPTKNAVDSGDTKAAQATLRANDTTQATTTGNGSVFVMLLYDNWNVLLPFDYMPGPEDEDREGILVSEALCLDLPATIVATVVSGYIKWAEVP